MLCAGSATRTGNGIEGRQVPEERNSNASEQREITRISEMHISKPAPDKENEAVNPNMYPECTVCYNIQSSPSVYIMLMQVSCYLPNLTICFNILLTFDPPNYDCCNSFMYMFTSSWAEHFHCADSMPRSWCSWG